MAPGFSYLELGLTVLPGTISDMGGGLRDRFGEHGTGVMVVGVYCEGNGFFLEQADLRRATLLVVKKYNLCRRDVNLVPLVLRLFGQRLVANERS